MMRPSQGFLVHYHADVERSIVQVPGHCGDKGSVAGKSSKKRPAFATLRNSRFRDSGALSILADPQWFRCLTVPAFAGL